MKHLLLGFVLIVAAGLLISLMTLRDESDYVAVENLESYGDCLLPGIHGAGEWVGKEDARSCRVWVLPGGFDQVGKFCYLKTYNLFGTSEGERYRVNERWFADEYQRQEVCRVYVVERDYDLLARKMEDKQKPPPPLETIASAPVSLAAREKALSFSLSLANDSTPEQVEGAAAKLDAVAREYLAYYERPADGKILDIVLSRRPLPETERFPFTIASVSGKQAWRFNNLDVLRDRDGDILGMSPERRREIFVWLVITSRAAATNFKDDEDAKRFNSVLYRDQRVTNDRESRILKQLGISSDQLKYVSKEGGVLGWGSEILDGVPESQRSTSVVKMSN